MSWNRTCQQIWIVTGCLVFGAVGMGLAGPALLAEMAPTRVEIRGQSPDTIVSDSAPPPVVIDVDDAPSMSRFELNTMILYLAVFVLAIFVGFEIITKVPPTLHTPLMSGSNAISGITLVGAMIVAGAYPGWSFSCVLGMIAVALAMINVVGGFLVTHRMLSMFQAKKRPPAAAK